MEEQEPAADPADRRPQQEEEEEEEHDGSILLFSGRDKRLRETRLRRSVVAIDDTDYLMAVRSA
eukprot:CAMPEP_0197193618 /NCGR_PEP_ID=MMETSP1423-20130617/27617_1 /TAXON_ID=476441 /ORGANISM="Pseudo-nitzschia heimii, Strain UNC1101" /LENGTH=63 /DNA_ID=CAMNT_0042646851 /DNA_START=53 /DNA_END=240 /DNA_ORIENTATION=+